MKLKTLTIKELRAKKTTDIAAYIAELEQNHVSLVHSISINKEKATHQFGVIKKSIARAKTIQSELARNEEK